MKIGIPKALYYYYIEDIIRFLKKLGIEIVMFDTDKEIIKLGSEIANDEMCLSMKIFLGHVSKLQSICDYILIPNLNNYGTKNQMCPNFTSLYNLKFLYSSLKNKLFTLLACLPSSCFTVSVYSSSNVYKKQLSNSSFP